MTSLATRKGGLELLADLERAGGLTPTCLTLDPDTPYGSWAAIGGLLGSLHRSVAWIAGDWVNHGEMAYGEMAAQAMDATGLALQTIANYSSVCRRVPPERRREALPFSSHALVAALKPREQERWLKRAEREGWTRRQLAEALNGAEPEKVTLRDLAQAVWTSARYVDVIVLPDYPESGYFVPAEPMKALGEAL